MAIAYKNAFVVLAFAMCMLSLLPSISADTLVTYPTKEINKEFTFCQICSDATYITLSSIETPNSTISINTNMTSVGSGEFCYNFTPTQIGRHDFRGVSDGCTYTFATYSIITGNGKTEPDGVLSSTFSIFYVLIFGFLIYLLIYCFGHFLKLDFDLIDLAYSYGFFFAYLTLFYLSKYYVGNVFMESMMELFLWPLGILLLVVPLIMFVISLTVGALKPKDMTYGTRRFRRSKL